MCATLLILGWKVLLPIDYKQLGNQVVMALSFASNFWFWRQTGYFAPGAEEQWLLHTWSLAVEWQFYLVLPLILMVVWRLRPRRSIVNAVIVSMPTRPNSMSCAQRRPPRCDESCSSLRMLCA